MSEKEYGFLYSRIRNPVGDLNVVVADLEGAEAAQAFSSGMAAITAALVTSLERGDTLLAASQLYGNTYGLIETLIRRLGVEVTYADVTDLARGAFPASCPVRRDDGESRLPLADLAAIAEGKGDGILIVDTRSPHPRCAVRSSSAPTSSASRPRSFWNGHHDVTAGGSPAVASGWRRRLHLVDTGAVLDAFPAFLLRRGSRRSRCASSARARTRSRLHASSRGTRR